MRRLPLLLLPLSCLSFSCVARGKAGLSFEKLVQVRTIRGPQVSPDGKTVAFTLWQESLKKNKKSSDIYLVPSKGGKPRRLTASPANDYHPRWSPDGKTIAFISSRGGAGQIWKIPVNGGEAVQVTKVPGGASNAVWAPDGKSLIFSAMVYPGCKDRACNAARYKARKKSKVKARVIDKLLYRHWNVWRDKRRKHLMSVPAAGGVAKDLLPGADYDVPPFPWGGDQDFTLSPDGKTICFASKRAKNPERSTNEDLFLMPVAGGEVRQLTDNKAYDGHPQFSPDGRYIAYLSQKLPGYESDRFRLMLYDVSQKTTRELSAGFDDWVSSFVWAPDASRIYFTSYVKGTTPLYAVDIGTGKRTRLLKAGRLRSLNITKDGKTLIFAMETLRSPPSIYRSPATGGGVPALITDQNAFLRRDLKMHSVEEFWFKGADGKKVHGFLLKPPGFDPSKKYPLIFMIHGGPQGAFMNAFHPRWNAQVFASPGYLVSLINPRGSVGYGQQFVKEVTRDWGGRAYKDLMKGLAHLIGRGFVDRKRVCAAGASYGGYMVNWIMGHNNKFACLISHAGVFNLESKYGTTEELWFPEWEFGGTPWDNPQEYRKWSPHRLVKNFKTPTLVIHGQRDYRVPVAQGFGLFTALQRQGVPSRMLYFPDEGHFVTKPLNRKLWFKTMLDWFKRYLK